MQILKAKIRRTLFCEKATDKKNFFVKREEMYCFYEKNSKVADCSTEGLRVFFWLANHVDISREIEERTNTSQHYHTKLDSTLALKIGKKK